MECGGKIMPKYIPWLGMTIWLGGTALAVLLIAVHIVSRETGTYLAALAFFVAMIWTRVY